MFTQLPIQRSRPAFDPSSLDGAVQVPLQDRRLKIAESLPLAPILSEELGLFRVKVTASANETFVA